MSAAYRNIMNEMAFAVALASQRIRQDFLSQSSAQSPSEKSSKGLPDFVTATDVAAQFIIQDYLALKFPGVRFVGEEGDKKNFNLNKGSLFLVDPLDGTSNFVALRDYFSCCAAYIEDGDVKVGVIADPMRGRIVKAYHGFGCFSAGIDDPGACEKLSELTGDGPLNQYQLECELAMSRPQDFEIISRLLPLLSGMRKSGSTALDVMNIAMGRKSVLISDGLLPHDIAAAVLIAREAGAMITDMSGRDANVNSESLVLSPPSFQKKILSALRL